MAGTHTLLSTEERGIRKRIGRGSLTDAVEK